MSVDESIAIHIAHISAVSLVVAGRTTPRNFSIDVGSTSV